MPSRKNNRKSRGTRRNRQSGGAPTDAELEAAVLSVIVDELDYERMRENEARGINAGKDWDAFLEFNQQCAKEMSDTDKFMFMLLTKRIKANKFKQMDLESCVVFGTTNMFFTTAKELVFVNPR